MSENPLRVVLLTQKDHVDRNRLQQRLPGCSLDQGDVVLDLTDSESADVVVVQNYLKYDRVVTAREGYVWKWDNEPLVREKPVSGYDRIYSHATYPRAKRVITAPPILDWWVGKSFDKLKALPVPEKTRFISAIASAKAEIPGHVRRLQFIQAVREEFPEIDFFGRGQESELADKWHGLGPYQYSIAIENSSLNDYWTEKISDCFLSYTVPLYFGAPNIQRYFPPKSFIWLPLDDFEAAMRTLRETKELDDWGERLDALREARDLVLNQYSFFAQVIKRVRAEADMIRAAPTVARKVHGRRRSPGGWVRGAGVVGNVARQIERLRNRVKKIFQKLRGRSVGGGLL